MPIKRLALPDRARGGIFQPCRGVVSLSLLGILLSPAVVVGQRNGGRAENSGGRGAYAREAGEFQPQRPGGGGFFRRLRELPPMQQERIMANNPQFRRLPPERQELIRERLRQWNAMTPQQQERVREREEILQGLSPAQRQEARTIFPQWRNLTPARRQAVMVAFRHLRDLPPDQRQSFLNSQSVREEFSPHERDILQGLNKLLPTPGAGRSDDQDE